MKHYLSTQRLCLFLALTCLQITFVAQQLPRRVYLGIRMERITDDMVRVLGLQEKKGVLIGEVFSGSTAQLAGIKKGDVLISVNKAPINSTEDVYAAIAGRKSGEMFSYDVLRNNKVVKGTSKFHEFPKENYAGIETIYSESKSAIGLQRIIITKPVTGKRLPVVAFVGGIGCYSLDFPLDTTREEVQLLNKLTRAGFMCARLEKPGMGDNAKFCKPCSEVSFKEETEGYVEAIKALKKREDVDSNAIFIIGHSMGGVFAPLIAKQTALKGVIAYGTIGSNFPEYMTKTRRTIAQAYKMSPEETDDMIKNSCECVAYYFVDKMTTKEAAAKNPVCGEYLPVFDYRSRAYNDELYSFNIPLLWKSFSGKALLLWGESDFISSKEDHQIISDAINYYHPGNSEFMMVKNSDHGMRTAKDFPEAQRNPGPYNPEVGAAIESWLNKQKG
jgi:uncharacterized protein